MGELLGIAPPPTDVPSPVRVAGLGLDVAEISLGVFHSCVRKNDGSVWCWGVENLADGLVPDSVTPPHQVMGPGAAVAIAAGWDATCARKSDGTLWCWGSNIVDGTAEHKPDPTRVTALGSGVVQVFIDPTPCARLADDTLRCWDGSAWTLAPAGSAVVEMSGDDLDRRCARKADGTLWCWGYDEEPKRNLSFGDVVAGVSVGPTGTCAFEPNGTLWCQPRYEDEPPTRMLEGVGCGDAAPL